MTEVSPRTNMGWTPKQALRRYLKLFIPSMTAYTVFIFLAAYLVEQEIVSGAMVYLVALLPAAAALVFLFAYFRFIGEMDELARRVMTEAIVAGAAGILALSLTWGILEMFVDTLPRLPLVYVVPIFFAIQGVASWRLSKKYNTKMCWI